jgi:quercetin dioxygenase-like cupin family protein
MQTRSPDSTRRAISRSAGGALFALALNTAAHAGEGVRVTDLMTEPLVGVPGKEVTMITVEYAPGGSDPVHRHNASAFVYVLEGVVEMQMAGGEKVTLRPGQTFYEDPTGVHLVGRNASATELAKFLVVLVKNQGAPVLVPVEP